MLLSIQVFQSTLRKYKDTLLGSEELQEYYDPESGEHIIDTDPQIFYTILHFYQTKGHLYCPPSITEERFLEEVRIRGSLNVSCLVSKLYSKIPNLELQNSEQNKTQTNKVSEISKKDPIV